MADTDDHKLRERLVKQIKGGEAFMPIDKMLEKIPFEKVGVKPANLPYSFYQQFYHIWYAQHDIIEFSINKDYKNPKWPDDYWSDQEAPLNEEKWEKLKEEYFIEREKICAYIIDEENDLFEPFEHGSGQTLFREALLIIEHTAYHTGQLLIILRLLNLHG